MNKFLFVFNEEDKNKLIKRGYEIMNQLNQGSFTIYQFKNNNKLNFDKSIRDFKYSDLMLF